jgi:hypothetical protein
MSNLTPRINRLESNLIIDGAMEIWPEGASRSVASGTNAYGSVLFRLTNASSGITLTNSRQTSIPSGTNLQFSNQVSKTAAGTLSAATAVGHSYFIEGYDTASIFNQEFSVVFWVRSSVASNRTVSLRNGVLSHSYLRQYSIAAANTWELKVLRFPALSTCPGALDRTNGLGAALWFGVVSGSSLQNSTLNSWLTGSFVSGVGEDTTWLTGTTHSFDIAGVMALPGNWEGLNAAQYNFVRAGRTFEEEVSMSQRYFEKSYNLNDAPGTGTLAGVTAGMLPVAINNTLFVQITNCYKTRKRATPIITLYSPATGAINSVSIGGTTRGAGAVDIGETSFGALQNQSGVTWADTAAWQLHYLADARF